MTTFNRLVASCIAVSSLFASALVNPAVASPSAVASAEWPEPGVKRLLSVTTHPGQTVGVGTFFAVGRDCAETGIPEIQVYGGPQGAMGDFG